MEATLLIYWSYSFSSNNLYWGVVYMGKAIEAINHSIFNNYMNFKTFLVIECGGNTVGV